MTRLKQIESLDELIPGKSWVVDQGGDRRKVLAKIDLIAALSSYNMPNSYNSFYTLEELQSFQLEVEEARWKPEIGKPYYYLDDFTKACFKDWEDSEEDRERLQIGNVYPNVAIVWKKRDQILKLLKED